MSLPNGPRRAACLQSAADLVDETIVVDTGSTDGTRDLAAKLGAKVFEFPWRDDFAAGRNECIRHATGSADAVSTLESLAKGVPSSRLTQEAKDSIMRIKELGK